MRGLHINGKNNTKERMDMNSFELIPTEENLIHTLNKDLLKRNKDLVRFYDLILAQEGASSIAIDGRWGSGKTFL